MTLKTKGTVKNKKYPSGLFFKPDPKVHEALLTNVSNVFQDERLRAVFPAELYFFTSEVLVSVTYMATIGVQPMISAVRNKYKIGEVTRYLAEIEKYEAEMVKSFPDIAKEITDACYFIKYNYKVLCYYGLGKCDAKTVQEVGEMGVKLKLFKK